jgi:hypothetical protein
MSSPRHVPRAPGVGRRPSLLLHDDSSPLVTRGSGALANLLRNRSSTSLSSSFRRSSVHHFHQDEEDMPGSTSGLLMPGWEDDEPPRRPAADERRLSLILHGPQMRSMRLIGNSNPRYKWERYWKTESQLNAMTKIL